MNNSFNGRSLTKCFVSIRKPRWQPLQSKCSMGSNGENILQLLIFETTEPFDIKLS